MHSRLVAVLLVVAALATWAALADSPADAPAAPSAQRMQPAHAGVEASTNRSTRDPASGVVERAALQAPLPAGSSRSASELRFELDGVAAGEYRGAAFLHPHSGEATSVAIAGPEIVIPMTGELRRVEFAVDGYCVAAYHGPFETPAPVRVVLQRAGEILVDVVDTDGHVLPGRLVYCYPLADAAPTDGLIRYRTTPWASTDERGRAHLTHVIAGDYRVHTAALAEWREAEVLPIRVSPRVRASCTLRVPVLAQDRFGGFAVAADTAPFVSSTPFGVVRQYRFWTDDGRSFGLHRVADTLRCIIPGEPGETVRGRIQWRGGSGVQVPSKESNVVTVSVGAVLSVGATWSDVSGAVK